MIETKPNAILPEAIQSGLEDLSKHLKSLGQQAGRTRTAAQTWDLHRLREGLPDLLDLLSEIRSFGEHLEGEIRAFRLPEAGGPIEAYTGRLRTEAARAGLTLTGDYPDFVAFPVELHADLAGEQARIGKKGTTVLEPRQLIAALQKEQARLNKSSFNVRRFMKALLEAYDLLIRARGGVKGTSGVMLADIHNLLTIRSGKAEYSRQAFAFDIYRLRRNSDLIMDGRRLQFENGRTRAFEVPTQQGVDPLNALRVLPVLQDD